MLTALYKASAFHVLMENTRMAIIPAKIVIQNAQSAQDRHLIALNAQVVMY